MMVWGTKVVVHFSSPIIQVLCLKDIVAFRSCAKEGHSSITYEGLDCLDALGAQNNLEKMNTVSFVYLCLGLQVCLCLS